MLAILNLDDYSNLAGKAANGVRTNTRALPTLLALQCNGGTV